MNVIHAERMITQQLVRDENCSSTQNIKSGFIRARARARVWWLISFSIIPNKLLLISSFYTLRFFLSCSHMKPSFIFFIRHIFTLFTFFFFFFIPEYTFFFIRNETNSKITTTIATAGKYEWICFVYLVRWANGNPFYSRISAHETKTEMKR